MKKTQHWITADQKPAERREAHIEALTNEIKQPIERVLGAVGLRSPLLRGGRWRCIDVAVCPVCGEEAPPDRPDLSPWLFGARKIDCVGGCEIGVRELFDIYCNGPEEVDAALLKISVGRSKLRRYYGLELLLSEAEGDRPAKWRRQLGDDMIATLAKLEPDKDSTVRGVAIDASSLLVAQATIRGVDEIPWCEKLPLDQRGKLTRIDWHNAPPSFSERELARRMAI